MRKVIVCFLIISVFGCTSYRFIYNKVPLNLSKYNSLYQSMKKDSTEIFVIFTKDFNNTKILSQQKNQILIDTILSTNDKKFAKSIIINKQVETKFVIDSKTINVKEEQFKNYNILYISKQKSKVTFEFSNDFKKL